IDMESGVRIRLDPNNFTSANRDYNTFLDYRQAEQPDQLFDYAAYVNQIDSALATIDAQIEAVAIAQDDLTERYQMASQAAQSSLAGSFVSQAQNLSAVLGGSLDTAIFGTLGTLAGGGGAGGQLLLSQGDIFGSLQGALQAQANVDPTILAQLR